ncbi:iron-containing alcohol dehydrogenase [Caproiciproducens sp. NJN-50]|uniref:iron-containing alcohol dehydrogenase n=1 Tax=Acutalibacteraceae TaxID=3082771 RepID=UPI000FFDFF4E|nr:MULTISPECIES: iron-containing alcohol dehydrogenase [Acutalibacteraceae]QAT50111.1 iron-containing alcohol dehydrogenase [Caproiciproducens sp. NJN-50]
MNYKIKMPSSVYGGSDSIQILSGIVKQRKIENVLLFTDPGVHTCGVLKPATDVLDKCGVSYRVIDHVVPEPTADDVQSVLDETSDMKCDLILAVGGGSTMDTAKLVSVLRNSEYGVRDLLKDSSPAAKKVYTVMVPTTCGTGSEATCNAIVAVPEEKLKVGIVSDEMIPDAVILDPAMIAGLPPKIIASSGIDALAHCVECYTSNKANHFSDVFALAGAKLIFGNIERAYAEPDDIQAKNNMLIGAFYGGVAITSSGTTAVHALSYPLGGAYHIAHGVSNAILFAPVMKHNMSACADRLAAICDAIEPAFSKRSETERSGRVIDRISEIVAFTKIPKSLKSFGVPASDLDFLVDSGSKVTRLLNNNRKKLSLEEIREIYQEVL